MKSYWSVKLIVSNKLLLAIPSHHLLLVRVLLQSLAQGWVCPPPGYLTLPWLVLCQNSNPNPVNLPSFSGSETLQKGNVSFKVWSYEVICLKNQLSENTLLQLVRSSLSSLRGKRTMQLRQALSEQQINKLLTVHSLIYNDTVIFINGVKTKALIRTWTKCSRCQWQFATLQWVRNLCTLFW